MRAEITNCFSGNSTQLDNNTPEFTKDIDAKWILRHRDILAKIVQYAIPEFKNCSYRVIVDAIPVDNIKMGEVPVYCV